MKYQYRNRSFWCRGYYVDTTGKNTKKINEYINNQIKGDRMAEQLTMEFNDPFKGRQAKISKSQADRGLGGLSERMSPMGDERKTTS